MGQEACKPAYPKLPNCHNIRGRRCGRKRIYVSFAPTLNSPCRLGHQHTEDHEHHELEDETVNSSRLSPLVEVSPRLLDETLPNNTETGEVVCQSVSSQTSGLESNQISGNPYQDSEDLAEYASAGHCDVNTSNGIDIVNNDCDKSDGKNREKDDAQTGKFLATEESDFEETLDNAVIEHKEEIKSFTGFEPQLSALSHSVSRERCQGGPMSLVRPCNIGSDLACANHRTFKSSTEGQAIPKSNRSDANCETRHKQNMVDTGLRSPVPIANKLDVNDGEADQGNSHELVVRPKIRSENTPNHVKTQQLLHSDGGEESGSCSTVEVLQGNAEHDLRKSRGEMSPSMLFHSEEYKGPQKNKELDLGKNAAAEEQKQHLGNSTSQDDSEDHSGDISMSHKHDSSECSDGECFEAVPSSPVVTERDQFSSRESWPIVPVRPEAQSSSSDKENQAPDFWFREGSMEEGDVPCLTAQKEPESSSDEEDFPFNDRVHSSTSILFMLDGDTNFENDSSVSGDMDVEWSLIDEAADSLRLRNPRYLTFMAIGGHAQRVVEHAIARLVSPEPPAMQPPHPPATKDTIDSLPFIVITDDHNGQQHCCTICCSECVKGETVTELPCHHVFHLSCVTNWLQQSGTCPVCRHVLAPVLPEAADRIRFGGDSASSVDVATGTSD